MNDHTVPLSTLSPVVRDFVVAVRRELSGLDPDELTEITDGLEADLNDLVAERGPAALGEPRAYARELLAAAGISGRPAPARGGSVGDALDRGHAWFDRQVDRLPGDPQPVLAWLRPAWWILRAWVAVQLIDLVFGGWPVQVVPHWHGLGPVVLAAAVLTSVQLGRGRFWPAGGRGVVGRLVLVGLNLFAVAMLPVVVGQVGNGYAYDPGAYNDGYQEGLAEARGLSGGGPDSGGGLYVDGRQVTNLYPYDAQGRRLAGVQLFDQDGKPLTVAARPVCPSGSSFQAAEDDGAGGMPAACINDTTGERVAGLVLYPWTNGQAQLRNVFPVAGHTQVDLRPSDTAFTRTDRPTLGVWPFAAVPRVSLPGITSGVLPGPVAKHD